MEHGEVICKVIVTASAGHERAVLRDFLDLVFPYDNGVVGFIEGKGKICIKTRLGAGELRRLLERYPIRNMLSVRYVLLSVESTGSLEDDLRKLVKEARDKGVKMQKIHVKLKARDGWKQEYFNLLRDLVKRDDGESVSALIEKTSGFVLLEVKIYSAKSASLRGARVSNAYFSESG